MVIFVVVFAVVFFGIFGVRGLLAFKDTATGRSVLWGVLGALVFKALVIVFMLCLHAGTADVLGVLSDVGWQKVMATCVLCVVFLASVFCVVGGMVSLAHEDR